MAKTNDLMQGRNQGLLMALNLVEKDGIDALRKEIKFRNIVGVSPSVTQGEIKHVIRRMEIHATQMAIAIAFDTLLTEFHMGKTQVQKFKETFDAKTDELCKNDGDTSEMLARIENELGMKITFNE